MIKEEFIQQAILNMAGNCKILTRNDALLSADINYIRKALAELIETAESYTPFDNETPKP